MKRIMLHDTWPHHVGCIIQQAVCSYHITIQLFFNFIIYFNTIVCKMWQSKYSNKNNNNKKNIY